MSLVNLTPHEIHIITEGAEIVVLPSGTVARCKRTRKQFAAIKVLGQLVVRRAQTSA